jgi:hypothetical protein
LAGADRHIACVAGKESLVITVWFRQYAGDVTRFLDDRHECK